LSASEAPVVPEPNRPSPPSWEAAPIGMIFMAVGVGAFWWAFSTPGTAGANASYAGDRACRECHAGQAASHSRSGHSQTLRRASAIPLAKTLDGVRLDDPEYPGVSWSYTFRDGKLSTERREGEEVERFVIEYAFGSGHHATTFVSLTDRDPAHPTMIEHRLTAFAHANLPRMTPGQSAALHSEGTTPRGRNHSTWNTLKCFECHTTVSSDQGPFALDEKTMIPNVGCERCHGPGRSHVEAARGGASGHALAMPMGPGRASPVEQMRLCGQCHRLPEMAPAGAIRPESRLLVRFQPIGLMQSACYTRGNATMTCTTCHDPHARASTDHARYEAVCLSCHQGAGKTPCKVSPKTGCIDCHMPRRDVGQGMMLSDHWIRARPGGDSTTPDK
jgi:hypothetical protein